VLSLISSSRRGRLRGERVGRHAFDGRYMELRIVGSVFKVSEWPRHLLFGFGSLQYGVGYRCHESSLNKPSVITAHHHLNFIRVHWGHPAGNAERIFEGGRKNIRGRKDVRGREEGDAEMVHSYKT
jgi:hypothetical protein